MVAKRRAGAPESTSQLGQERDAALFDLQEDGYGSFSGGGGFDQHQGVFETYLTEVLCPTLKEGQVVVMDNLSSHKGSRVRELIEDKGCELIYLPSYSPDFNPIEQAFSKLKSYLREACARSHEMLVDVIGDALATISASDAKNFYNHCGYRTMVQPL
jgi:transposase